MLLLKFWSLPNIFLVDLSLSLFNRCKAGCFLSNLMYQVFLFKCCIAMRPRTLSTKKVFRKFPFITRRLYSPYPDPVFFKLFLSTLIHSSKIIGIFERSSLIIAINYWVSDSIYLFVATVGNSTDNDRYSVHK